MSQVTQKLVTDLGVLVGDAEELVKATAAQTGEKIVEMRGKIQQSVANVKPRLAQAQTLLREKTAVAVETADDYVHTHPWPVVGMAAGIGLLVGLLVSRR